MPENGVGIDESSVNEPANVWARLAEAHERREWLLGKEIAELRHAALGGARPARPASDIPSDAAFGSDDDR